MKKTFFLVSTALFIALPIQVAAQTVVGSQAAGGRRIEATADSSTKRVVSKVYEGKYSFVRIEEREPGALVNRHPLSISPHALRSLLASALIKVEGKPEPLFNTEQLDEITAPLSQALARAQPTQDVSFAVAGLTTSFGMFASRSVTTARVFAHDKNLEIIFGLGQKDFENQMRGTGILIAFEPGQRGRQVDANLQISAPQTIQHRADWVSVDLSRLESMPQTSLLSAPAAGAGIAHIAPGASATNPAAPRGSPQTAETLYNNLSERFKALQKLRDTGLITESEYEAKRKSLLGEL